MTSNSECEVELDTIFNSSVHLSFQVKYLQTRHYIWLKSKLTEPKEHSCHPEDEGRWADGHSCLAECATEESNGGGTITKFFEKNKTILFIHQVEIDGAKTCQIQIAQSVPIASPLTWNLVGDPGKCGSTCFSLLVIDDNVGLGEYVCSCAW